MESIILKQTIKEGNQVSFVGEYSLMFNQQNGNIFDRRNELSKSFCAFLCSISAKNMIKKYPLIHFQILNNIRERLNLSEKRSKGTLKKIEDWSFCKTFFRRLSRVKKCIYMAYGDMEADRIIIEYRFYGGTAIRYYFAKIFSMRGMNHQMKS